MKLAAALTIGVGIDAIDVRRERPSSFIRKSLDVDQDYERDISLAASSSTLELGSSSSSRSTVHSTARTRARDHPGGLPQSEGGTASDHAKFVLASSPTSAQVVYTSIPTTGTATPLIESGLTKPLGIAVYNQLLYVADSGAKTIVKYNLAFDPNDGKLRATKEKNVAENVEATDVSVDSAGTVFFTDKGDIFEVDDEHPTEPIKVYRSANLPELNSVESLFSDNFSVYWANGSGGTQFGTLLKAPQKRPQFAEDGSKPPGLKILTHSNHPDGSSAQGLCGAGDSIFYTGGTDPGQATGTLTRANKAQDAQGPVYSVDSTLTAPKHCAWDKESSIMLSDATGVYRYGGALSKKAGSMFMTRELLFDLADAHGVDVWYAPKPGDINRPARISGRLVLWTTICASISILAAILITV